MKVEKNSIVKINYTLKNDEGQVLDTSIGGEPLEYMHGNGMLLQKLEDVITGKDVGEKFTAVLEPKDGYGEFDNQLVVKVPRDQFDTSMPIEVGMRFQAETAYGPQIVIVKEVTDKEITVDGNHELAGVRLNFEVEIVDCREPTAEELENGLSCGCGCGCGGDCGCDGECGEDCQGGCGCQ